MMLHKVKYFFTEEEKDDIILAIQNSEVDSSGEIRVHIDNTCEGEVMDCAYKIFNKLGMQNTKLRNGVLFYLAIHNRKFAVIADDGISDIVPDDFWEKIKQILLNNFREEKFADGLCEAIIETGEQLKNYFPCQPNDINELPDKISFGKI